jgi:hypothetical protein
VTLRNFFSAETNLWSLVRLTDFPIWTRSVLDYFDIASQHRTSVFLTMKLIFALAANDRNPPLM